LTYATNKLTNLQFNCAYDNIFVPDRNIFAEYTFSLYVAEKNYSHFDFNIEQICNNTGMGQTALRRKMSALFNKSPMSLYCNSGCIKLCG
jgi:hypothetical protein